MGANIERDKLKTRKDKLAGYFFDISKLSFGAMVLGGLTPMITGEFDYMNLLYVLFGVCMTIMCEIKEKSVVCTFCGGEIGKW